MDKKTCGKNHRIRVPKEGFEPSREYSHYALNVARLPNSATSASARYCTQFLCFVNLLATLAAACYNLLRYIDNLWSPS